MTLPLSVGGAFNCADRFGAATVLTISSQRFPTISDPVVVAVKTRKSVTKFACGVIVRQRRQWRRSGGATIVCADNAAVIVNEKGEPKGSAITGPVARECVQRWPKVASVAVSVF
jgi:large subunit ribosomal protein L23e